jgi:Fe-S cluster assembly protein SufB
MAGANPELERLAKQDYKYGFVTDIEEDRAPPGLTEDVVRLISSKKNEPEWLLEYRLKAFHRFREMLEDENANPEWAKVVYPAIDYDSIV